MTVLRLVAGVVVVAALASGGWYWHVHSAAPAATARAGGAAGAAAARPVSVTLGTVAKGSFRVTLDGLGSVEALNSVTVRSRIDGEITAVAFKEGDLVHEGDLLAQIDPRAYQAALDQASAKKTQDDATLANATLDLERYAKLGAEAYAARQQVDTQRSQVAQLSAQGKSDQAAIDLARTQLSYATIRAPITGRVGFRLVDQGNIVSAASTTGIAVIQQIQPISVVFTAPEEALPAVSAAMKRGAPAVEALTTDRSRTLSKGVLSVINNEVDTASGTIRLKATFTNADEALWPGLAVVTRLLVDTLDDVTLIPSAAVQHGPDGLFTYVVDEGSVAHVVPIAVGNQDDTSAVVTKGVKAGDRIVVAGQYKLGDKTKVDAKPAEGRTADAGTTGKP